MNANELRINNLVEYSINDTFTDRLPNYGKNIYRVVGIFEDSIKIDLGFESSQRVLLSDSKLKPIPFTDKWVNHFGMVKESCGNEWYRKNDFFVSFKAEMVSYNNRYYSESNNFEIPKYVHQLQNLYFALTGEELV